MHLKENSNQGLYLWVSAIWVTETSMMLLSVDKAKDEMKQNVGLCKKVRNVSMPRGQQSCLNRIRIVTIVPTKSDSHVIFCLQLLGI